MASQCWALDLIDNDVRVGVPQVGPYRKCTTRGMEELNRNSERTRYGDQVTEKCKE
jgi:hypothetical protein